MSTLANNVIRIFIEIRRTVYFGKTATNWEPTHFHLFSPMLSMQISKPSRRPSVEAIRSTCKRNAWSSIAHCKKNIGHTQLLSSPTRTTVLQNHCYKYFSKAVLHCQCVLHLLKMPNDWRYMSGRQPSTLTKSCWKTGTVVAWQTWLTICHTTIWVTAPEKYQSGVEINARPLARGEWKSRGMSRIFAQVVRRASGYLNLFCQLYVPTNESNYWNISRMTVNSITNHQNNLVDLITVCKLLLW